MNEKSKTDIVSISVLVILIIILCSIIYAGQVPKAEKNIPIFPGAVRDLPAELEMKEQQGEETSPDLVNQVHKVYKTGASAEEIFEFYLKMIGGKEGESTDNPMNIQPGAASQVWYQVEFWKDQDFKDIVYDTHLSGDWMKMKQNLEKNRKPYKAGKWIKNAGFEWCMKEANNDLVQFYLNIEDITFNWNTESSAPTDNRATTSRIDVQVITQKSEEAMREETEEESDRVAEELAKSLKSNPPTEKDLGAPLYPGARFDAENSAGMSAGNDYRMYLYLTNDPPLKVAAFYEQKLKIKPFTAGKDHYMFPLKGKPPIPEEGISVEPNTMFGGSAKTVITIQKMVSEPE